MCMVNPKTDIIFRKLFGSEENKKELMGFINAVLPPDERIQELVIKNPYNLASYIEGKNSILDVKAQDERGRWYDVELQITEQGFFGKRMLYYLEKVYTDQLNVGDGYKDLNKVIGIALIDFKYFFDDRYHRCCMIRDIETGDVYPQFDYLELHVIEMCKFDKQFGQLRTALDRWIAFMNRAYQIDARKMPPELAIDSTIVSAVAKLETMSLAGLEREIYEAEEKRRLDWQEEMRTALEKGHDKGVREGVAKGKAEGWAEGKAEGWAAGKAEGVAAGVAAGMRQALDRLLASGMDEAQARKVLGLDQ